ncbi:MAG: T9SS type A sorting domain-containing protein [Bacteroidetes bacterium]|nr:T9SS type A sorting domain-containing protein [Bacteroidota bacterium]
MRKLFTPLLVLCFTWANAQITLTHDDFPKAGDTVKTQTAVIKPKKLPLNVFNIFQDSFALDLSGMTIVERGEEVFDEVGNLTGGADIKNAHFGYETPDGTLFFRDDTNSMELTGIGQNFMIEIGLEFDSSIQFLKAPMSYPYLHKDSAYAQKNILNLALVKAEINSNYEVNGYGTLKTPGDSTFEVLRVRRTIRFKTTTTITFPPSNEVSYDSLVTWEFYAKGVKSTILRIIGSYETDPGGNITDTNILFTFYDYGGTTIGKEAIDDQKLAINQVGNSLQLVGFEKPAMVEVYTLSGVLVKREMGVMSGELINVSSAKPGIYIAKATSVDGITRTKKLLVH